MFEKRHFSYIYKVLKQGKKKKRKKV